MKKPKSDMSSQIKDMVNNLEKETEELLSKGPDLEIIDLSFAYNHMFSQAAERGMKTKVISLVHEREIKVIHTLQTKAHDKVEYFGAMAVGKRNIVKAARAVTDQINKYAAKGYVTGCLAPLGCIQMATEPFELERWSVFCFVSMTEDGSKTVLEENSPVHMKNDDKAPSFEVF